MLSDRVSESSRFIRSGHTCLGVARPGGLILTTGDRNSSPLWSRTVGTSSGQLHTWSPWGAGPPLPGLPGFNGERPDPVSGSYHLGNGYRAYNPLLMRFNCPDNLSPFGVGGINPYAYCAGDPVNHTDPTGHLSWQGILGIVVSTIGLALAAFSAGSSIAAAGSITAAITTAPLATATGGLAVVADATGIASVATENSNPSASAVLGWVSLGTGVAALAAGIGQAGSSTIKRLRNQGNHALPHEPIINLHPENAPPVKYTKGFAIEEYSDHTRTLGFISDIGNTGEPAIILHGNGDNGALAFETTLNWSHEVLPVIAPRKSFYYMHEFDSYLQGRGLNLSTIAEGKPVHLISCYSGRVEGIAQRAATYFNRPFIGYGSKGSIYTTGTYERLNGGSQYVKKFGLFFKAKKNLYLPQREDLSELDMRYL
ncbi:RHS repeat-associated core domain-containing protein [Yokenella regensburgei]|uniref:RHS repeat-associated core domain-containing protein n=1 Tax=Yokenella regensburgei TaxID=158877 RepID=UPI0014330703|nr:RHS repeat-associated core domain-containing protein [Yokenella regensburgei]QIU88442.1 RHS repeat-associated core domain-containing protein [Yokenella regensburgei]